MAAGADLLTTFRPTAGKRFFIGFDSDGCVFDTMEVKHKECFTPVTIWKWDLQAVSRYARECHEFVNLYSKWRGINRFPALVKTLEMLAERPQARARTALATLNRRCPQHVMQCEERRRWLPRWN